jgi:hypothetical protein
MSSVRKPIAVAVSDLHLSDHPPVWRSCEASWYTAMLRPITQLKKIANRYDPPLPVICAGDIFHHWRVSPELINFALKHLPYMYAIPGQHDLPYHRLQDIHRSAFWTLVEANKVHYLAHRKAEPLEGLILHGFPWGCEIHPPLVPMPLGGFNVAVIHAYVWTKRCSYPGANSKVHLHRWRLALAGFRLGIFGDNHMGFLSSDDKTTVLNCGGFMRRNADQALYQPKVSLIWSDGTVTREPLDVSEDKTLNAKQVAERVGDSIMDLSEFFGEMASLRSSSLDFAEALKQWMDQNKVLGRVRECVLAALEGNK